MPVINVADVPITLIEQKPQGPRLNFMDSDGGVFYLPMMKDNCPNSINVFDGTDIYSAAQKIMYLSIDSFNSCDDILLPAGCWSVELQGGKGGDGGNETGNGKNGDTQIYNFKLLQPTTVSVFRGADGMAGTVNSSSNYYSGGGGGASGLPSMVKINDEIIIASGGAGGMGAKAKSKNSTYDCAAGGGGNAGDDANGVKAIANISGTSCGAGGGGASVGKGGNSASDSTWLFITIKVDSAAGANGTSTGGGNGGGVTQTVGSDPKGGTGGKNVTMYCKNISLVSYGGGGGGALVVSGNTLAGGNGGSDTSGTSTTSKIIFYRYGI